jgi:hypothetical protein
MIVVVRRSPKGRGSGMASVGSCPPNLVVIARPSGRIGEREIPGRLEAAADEGGDGKAAWFVMYTPHTGASL